MQGKKILVISLLKALPKGVELEAAARHLQVAANLQKQSTAQHFEQSILAVHHLPHEADRAALILSSGVLELLDSGKAFTSLSPEVLELKRFVLERSEEWCRYFGYNFTADQAAISFLTRVAKRLGIRLCRSRPRATSEGGGSHRPYQYQVMTVELVNEQIEEAKEQLDFEGALDLLEVQSQLEVRGALLRAAIDRYSVLLSTLSIHESVMESVGQRGSQEEGAESLVALSCFWVLGFC